MDLARLRFAAYQIWVLKPEASEQGLWDQAILRDPPACTPSRPRELIGTHGAEVGAVLVTAGFKSGQFRELQATGKRNNLPTRSQLAFGHFSGCHLLRVNPDRQIAPGS